jgi:hypothetical protein
LIGLFDCVSLSILEDNKWCYYVVSPVLHPLPTTKSWLESNVAEKELLFGEKLTSPPVV